MLTYFLTYANSIHKNALLSDDLASDVKRLSVSYDKQNAAWTKYKDYSGFYSKEKSFVNGKPSYISEEGPYAIWYDEENKWCVGHDTDLYLSYIFPGRMVSAPRLCVIFAFGRVRSGGNDVDPTDSGYVWGFNSSIATGRWEPANGDFKIIPADGNSILYFYGPKKYLTKKTLKCTSLIFNYNI